MAKAAIVLPVPLSPANKAETPRASQQLAEAPFVEHEAAVADMVEHRLELFALDLGKDDGIEAGIGAVAFAQLRLDPPRQLGQSRARDLRENLRTSRPRSERPRCAAAAEWASATASGMRIREG